MTTGDGPPVWELTVTPVVTSWSDSVGVFSQSAQYRLPPGEESTRGDTPAG